MRWPWQKETEVTVMEDEIEEQEEQQDQEDTLDDLDPEILERVNARISREKQQYEDVISQARQNMQSVGLDLSADYRVAIRDPEQVAKYVNPMFQPNPQPAHSPAVAEEEDDGWADPTLDSDRFNKQLSKVIEKATNSQQEYVKRLEATIQSDRIETAVGRVGEAVEKYVPVLAPILEHPEFERNFRDALKQVPMEQWTDGRSLARIAALLSADLPASEVPAKRGPGRPAGSTKDAAQAAVNRVGLAQSTPSRQSGNSAQPNTDKYTEVDKVTAQVLGISLEEAAALAQPADWKLRADQGEDMFKGYRAARDKRVAAEGRRRV